MSIKVHPTIKNISMPLRSNRFDFQEYEIRTTSDVRMNIYEIKFLLSETKKKQFIYFTFDALR